MQIRNINRLLVIVVFALFSLTNCSNSFGFQFGYIDAAKVFAKYSETQKTRQILESEKEKLQKQLDKKKEEVAQLNAKYVETAKKLQQLRDAKKENEAKKLEAQLKAEREALANANSELQKFFEESQKKLYALEDEKMGSLLNLLGEKVEKIIEKIAKAKKLDAIFEKKVCFYGGIDITDEIIEELNKTASENKASSELKQISDGGTSSKSNRAQKSPK